MAVPGFLTSRVEQAREDSTTNPAGSSRRAAFSSGIPVTTFSAGRVVRVGSAFVGLHTSRPVKIQLESSEAFEGITPNKTEKVGIDAIVALSNEIDLAERRGWITNEEEDALQNRLLEVLNFLIDGNVLLESLGCAPELTRNECAQQALLEVEFRLRGAKS